MEMQTNKKQVLIRKEGVPFTWGSVSFDVVYLCFRNLLIQGRSIPEGRNSRENFKVLFEVYIYKEYEDIEINPSNFLAKYSYTFTKRGISVTETLNLSTTQQNSSTKLTAEILNFKDENGNLIPLLKMDSSYSIGVKIPEATLLKFLELPSMKTDKKLKDEWKIFTLPSTNPE